MSIKHVVEINAGAIGIDDFPLFKEIKLGRFYDLVAAEFLKSGTAQLLTHYQNFVELWVFTVKSHHWLLRRFYGCK